MPRVLSPLADQHRQQRSVGWVQLLTIVLNHATLDPLTIRASSSTQYLPRLLLDDLFDRSGPDLGPDWQPTGEAGFNSLAIVSEAIRAAADGGTDSLEVVNIPDHRSDVFGMAEIGALGSGGGRVGIWLRATSSPVEGYVCAVTPTTVEIIRYEAGVPSVLASGPASWAPGDIMWAEADGATIRIKKDRVLMLQASDPAPFLTGDLGASIFCPSGQPLSDYAITMVQFGNLREEYLPLVQNFDVVGDSFEASNVASAPSSISPTVFNMVPISAGGVFATRFSDLFQAGANASGYLLTGGLIQVEWLPPGGVVGIDSIVLYQGKIEAPEDLNNSLFRLPSTSREGAVRIAVEDAVVVGDNTLTPIEGAYIDDGSSLLSQYTDLIDPEWTPAHPADRIKFLPSFTPTSPASGGANGPPSFEDFEGAAGAAALAAGSFSMTLIIDYTRIRQAGPGGVYPAGTMKLNLIERVYCGFYRNLLDVSGTTLSFEVDTTNSVGDRWDTGVTDPWFEVVALTEIQSLSQLQNLAHDSIESLVSEVLYEFQGSQAGPHTVTIGSRRFIMFRHRDPVPIPPETGFTFDGEVHKNFDELDVHDVKVTA